MQVTSKCIIAATSLEVGSGKDPYSNHGEEEDTREDDVCLQGEDEEGEESEAPDDQEERNDGVV